jgi:hypothetical protein
MLARGMVLILRGSAYALRRNVVAATGAALSVGQGGPNAGSVCPGFTPGQGALVTHKRWWVPLTFAPPSLWLGANGTATWFGSPSTVYAEGETGRQCLVVGH